jgi:hypothetical protein
LNNSQKGQALISVVAGVSLVLLSLVTALIITQFSGKVIVRQLTYQGQALNAAQAGLTEGLSWFTRQTVQPVQLFEPVQDLVAVPQVNDTEDANCNSAYSNLACTGLVRTYQVSGPGNVWARYQLTRTKRAADPVAYATNTTDITSNRGKAGVGIVWQMESQGTIFVRSNPAVAYNVLPNKVLARRTVRAEIQRLGLTRPADAAIVTNRSDAINLPQTDILIDGTTGQAIQWVNTPAGGSPIGAAYTAARPNSMIKGTTSAGISATPDHFSIPYIFGMTQQELINQATLNAPNVASLPATLPNMSLIVLNNPVNPNQNFQFTAAQPLTGTGILVVLGNLVLAPNSNSVYSGLVYVRGTVTMNVSSTIDGMLIVDASGSPGVRTILIQGNGDKATVKFDRSMLDFIAQSMGSYSISRSTYIPCVTGQICDE